MDALEYREYGLMKVNQRKLETTSFPVWTAIQDCEGENCISANVCPYLNGTENRKCAVMMKYLKQVEKTIMDTHGKNMDDFDLFRVGMHIVPLYKQLVRLKIIEMSISSRSIPEMTKAGTTKIHSLFKEIRECVKAIDSTWRDLGISKGEQPKVADLVPSERGYYEKMEKEALKEQKRLKLVRRGNG